MYNCNRCRGVSMYFASTRRVLIPDAGIRMVLKYLCDKIVLSGMGANVSLLISVSLSSQLNRLACFIIHSIISYLVHQKGG